MLAREDRRLGEILEKAESKVAPLARKDGERSRWFENHPEVPQRLEAIDSEVSGTEWEADRGRRDVERELNPELERPYVREHERSWSRDDDYDRDIERDYGFGL